MHNMKVRCTPGLLQAIVRRCGLRQRFATTHFGYEQVDEEEKARKVGEVFSGVASKYDLMNDVMSTRVHRLWKDYFVQQLRLRRNSEVIDMAGGTGDIAFRISQRMGRGATGSITIADINEEMLNAGKDRASANSSTLNSSQLKWVCANAETLPFPDNAFDLYTIAFGIRNCTNIDKGLQVLSEAQRVLKPGGQFACLEFSHVDFPPLRMLYDLYSFQVIPVMGQIVAGDFKSYKYLVESIRQFPNQEAFAEKIRTAGFQDISYENLTGGVCAIHSGFK